MIPRPHTCTSTAQAAVLLSAILALSACGSGGDDTGSDNSATAQPAAYVGFFYNTAARTGGFVAAELTPGSTSLTGTWNFTQDEAESTVLCGAGDITLQRSGQQFEGSFVSADTDTGCGFDHGAVMTLQGSSSTDDLQLTGNYSAANAGGSNISGGSGQFDVWKNGPQTLQTCTGVAVVPATTTHVAATVTQVLAGYLDGSVIWGVAKTQNFDPTTGALHSDCTTDANVIGLRNAATGAVEFKWIATGRTGTTCTTTTANDTAHFAGSYSGSGLSASATAVSGDALTWSMTCTSGPVASAAGDSKGVLSAARRELQAQAARILQR